MGKKAILLCLLLTLVCIVAGCSIKPETEFKQTGTTCTNAVMGMGTFAYSNDFLYIGTDQYIYEYDLQSGKTVSLSKDSGWTQSLFVTDNYIYWAEDDKGLQYMTKDGKHKDIFYAPTNSRCWYLYAEDKELFYLDAIGSDLYYQRVPILKDAENTEAKVLCSHVNQYYVDEDYVYAIILANDEEGESNNYLVRSPRTSFSFEKIDLSFPPVNVVSYQGDLYLSTQGSFQIIRRTRNQGEISLPIYSTFYQLIDGNILYLDSKTYKNSCFTLKQYNLETGVITDLAENVYNFCILEDRYICIQNGANQPGFQYYDWQTKKITSIMVEE